jgi:23S rRNA maturation-related 3'-5' exoribonuclease YhaM
MGDKFIELLRSTKREGIEELIAYLEFNDFFTAPASATHHYNNVCGLVDHTMNVYNTMKQLAATIDLNNEVITDEQIIITALGHDLGKMGSYGKPMYVKRTLKTGKPAATPYEINKDLLAFPHEIRSLNILHSFIEITEEEEYAILYHATSLGELRYTYKKPTALLMLLFFADYWSSAILEKKVNEYEY